MKKRTLYLFLFLLSSLVITSSERSFPLRQLEFSSNDVLFQADSFLKAERNTFKILSRKSSSFPVDKIKSINITKITKEESKDIICNIETTGDPVQSNDEQISCSLSYTNDELTFSLWVEENTIYSINAIHYSTEDGAETESTLNFPKGNIPRFRVNQQNKPEVNDIVIGKYGDESVYIDFLFEESTSPQFYKEFEKLECTTIDLRVNCKVPFGGEPTKVNDILMLLDNIYYTIDKIEIMTYEKVGNYLKEGIRIHSLSSLKDFTIEGIHNEDTITLDPIDITDEKGSSNGEEDSESNNRINTKIFELSEYHHPNGIFETFTLKNEDKDVATLPKEIGNIIVNTVVQANIKIESNQDTSQSKIYLLFARPLFEIPKINSIEISTTIKADDGQSQTKTETIKVDLCSISDSHYSLVCESTFTNPNDSILYNIITDDSYLFNVNYDLQFQSYNLDESIIIEHIPSSFKINIKDKEESFLNDEDKELQFIVTFNQPTTSIPNMKLVKYLSNNSAVKPIDKKLSLNGKKMLVKLKKDSIQGIYQLIYGEKEDISYYDICLFYQNEVELENEKINLPIGNANIDIITINLKNEILNEQIRAIKYHNEYLNYKLSNYKTLEVNVPKDFTVSKENIYTITITDFHNEVHNFIIEITDVPPIILSQTFFVNKDNSDEYSMTVSVEENKVFQCELKVTNDENGNPLIDLNEKTPAVLSFSNFINIDFIIDKYEYTFYKSNIYDFNTLFKKIDTCFLSKDKYLIEPNLSNYYAINLSQNDFRIEVKEQNSDGDEIIMDYSKELSQGTYTIHYYYKKESQSFNSQSFRVVQPSIPDYTYIEEDGTITFKIDNMCDTPAALKIKKDIETEINCSYSDDQFVYICPQPDTTFDESESTSHSISQGQYNLLLNGKVYKQIFAYNQLKSDDLSIEIDQHSGINSIKISLQQDENSDSNFLPKNLTQIDSITVTKQDFTSSPIEEPLDITYSSSTDDENLKITVDNNMITLPIEIEEGCNYILKEIKLKNNNNNPITINYSLVSLPKYENVYQYIFFNSKSEYIYFNIKTLTSDNSGTASINVYMKEQADATAECNIIPDIPDVRIYQCKYKIENKNLHELSFKGNKEDTEYHNISLIKYELNEEDKCLIYPTLTNGKIIKLKIYSEVEPTKIIIDNDKYYFGEINAQEKTIEYNIDVSKYEVGNYQIFIEKDRDKYPIYKDKIEEEIVIKQENSIISIIPPFYTLSDSNTDKITIKLSKSIGTNISQLSLKLLKYDSNSIELTCDSNDGLSLECSINEIEENDKANKSGDYIKMEYVMDNCKEIYDIDFTLTQYEQIKEDFDVDFYVSEENESKQYKVIITSDTFSLDNIKQITFDSTSKKDTFCKNGEEEKCEVEKLFTTNENTINLNLPFKEDKVYSLIEIINEEDSQQSYKLYKPNQKIIRDYYLEKELFVIEKEKNENLNIVIDFYQKEIAEKRKDTIKINENEINNCDIKDNTKLECPYSYTTDIVFPLSLSIKPSDNDQIKTITILQFIQNKKNIPIGKEDETVTISFSYNKETPLNAILYLDDIEINKITLSNQEGNNNSITITNDKFITSKEYIVYIKLENSNNKVSFASINAFNELTVESFSKDTFYETDKDLNIIITFNNDITFTEIENRKFSFKKDESVFDCEEEPSIHVESNQISCILKPTEETSEGKYSLTYSQYHFPIMSEKQITFIKEKDISISPLIIMKSSLPKVIGVTYSAQKLSELTDSFTVKLIEYKNEDVKMTETCTKENDCTLTLTELPPGKYKIRTEYTIETENKSFESVDSILIIENEIKVIDQLPSVELTKGFNNKAIDLNLQYSFYEEQIEGVTLVLDDNSNTIIYNLKKGLRNTNENDNDMYNTISLYFESIIIDNDKGYTIKIKSASKEEPITIPVDIVDKYKIKSIINKRIQIGKDLSFELNYSREFENNEKPIQIELIEINSNPSKKFIFEGKEKLEVVGDKVICKLGNHILNQEGFYSIKTIFDDSINNYYSTTTEGKDLFIASFLTPPPTFNFSRLYLTEKGKIKIEVVQYNENIISIDCRSDDCIKDSSSNNKYLFNLTKEGDYIFTYSIDDNYIFQINQKVSVKKDPIISIKEEIDSCQYYKRKLSFTLVSVVNDEEYMNRIKVILNKIDDSTFNPIKLEKDDKGVYSFLNEEEFKGKAELKIIENDDDSQPLHLVSITFTDLLYPLYAYPKSSIIFQGQCVLSNLVLSRGKEYNKEIIFSQDDLTPSITLSNVKTGQYTLKIGDESIGEIMIINYFKNSQFKLNIPPVKINEPITITIISPNNEFNMKLIEEVSITKNDNKNSIVGFKVENNILSFDITIEQGDIYSIDSIKKKREESETVEEDNDLIMKLDESTNKIITDRFKLNNIYFYGFEGDIIEVDVESISNQHSAITIQQKEHEEDNSLVSCDQMKCTIEIKSSSIYIIKDTTTQIEKEIYVSILDIDKDYPTCQTILFDNSSSTTVLKIKLTSPIKLPDTPTLKFNNVKCESLQAPSSNAIYYSLKIKKDFALLKDSNMLTLEIDNETINLQKEYSYYSKNSLTSFSGLLIGDKNNQNIIITLERESENLEQYFISGLEKQEIALSSCTMFESKTYECEVDLSNTIEGNYQLLYQSECGEEITLDKSITVISESDLPFTFPNSFYILQESKEEGKKYEEILIEIKSTKIIPGINVYYKEKDNPSDTYQIMKLGEDNTSYSALIEPISAIEYEFAYSYMINGYKIPLSQTIKLITSETKEISIEPELSSCYYYKEPISFKIIPLSEIAFKDADLKVSLSKTNDNKVIELTKKEDNLFTLPNDNREPGIYQIMIEENNTNENKFYRVIDITLTNMYIDPLYYKSSIVFRDLTCNLNSLYIQKEKETEKTKLICSEKVEEDKKNLGCIFPETMNSFGQFLLYSGNNLITSSLQIFNDFKNSNFTLMKKPKIVKGINKFYLSSEDFPLEYIKVIKIMVDGTGPFEYKKSESDYIFNYLDDSKRIEIIVDIKDITKEYIIIEITSDPDKSKTVNLVLTEIEECPNGQVINSLNYCDDPENVEDEKVDKCENYCKNNKKCIIENSVPKCECDGEYFGLQCELKTEEDITSTVSVCISEVFSNLSEDADETTTEEFVNNIKVSQVKSLSILIVQKPELVIEQMETERNKIYNSSKKSIKSIIKTSKKNKKNPPKHSFALIHCAILIQVNFLKYGQSKLRNLQEEINELNELVQLSHNLFASQVYELTGTYINETDITGTIIHQGWTNTTDGLDKYSKMSSNNKLTQITINQCEGLDNNFFTVQTNVIQPSNENNLNTYINAVNKDGSIFDLSSCKNIEFTAILNDEIDSELAQMYALKGIDIYNPQDPAFQDSCYINEEFDFDLTQEYRRKIIFQNKTFKMNICSYDHANYANNTIYFTDCSIKNTNTNNECNPTEENCIINEFPTFEIVPYSLSLDGIDVDHADNLPTKCAGDVKDIHKNIAFWIYLLIFVLLIALNIILCVMSKKQVFGSVNEQALSNDLQINHPNFKNVATTESNLKNEGEGKREVSPSEVRLSIESQSFGDIFLANFKALHPLFSLCHSSLFSPILFTSWVFVYNIFNLFGFNALYFNETMIEDRITDKHRDNFGYPMKTEFEKIISAIVTSIALNLIVRGITIVTYKQKEELAASYKPGEMETKVVNEFIKSMLVRRVLAGIFMLILSIFFFYYTIVFCGIYINAQYGWFYSGIWSLFWVWICFAPIYIAIISIVESKGNSQCAFYMKRLFIF